MSALIVVFPLFIMVSLVLPLCILTASDSIHLAQPKDLSGG